MTGRPYFYLSFLLAATLLLTYSLSLSAVPTINRIAYIDRAGGLYTIRPDGTDRREMASGEMLQQVSFAPRPVQQGRDFYSWPVWSPNGQRLASFRVELTGGQPTDGLYIFDAASGRVLHAYKEAGLQPIYAYWSPTSQQLAILLGGRGPFSLNLWPTSNGQRPQRLPKVRPFTLIGARMDKRSSLTREEGAKEKPAIPSASSPFPPANGIWSLAHPRHSDHLHGLLMGNGSRMAIP